MDSVPLTPTSYPQGRGKDVLFGSPYAVCLGFPLNSSRMTTHGNVEQQKIFLSKVFEEEEELCFEDACGSSEYPCCKTCLLKCSLKSDEDTERTHTDTVDIKPFLLFN